MRKLVLSTIGIVALSACTPSEPRSRQYFEAHIDEARTIVEGCRDGSVRGDECDNAEMAVKLAEAKERRQKFFGTGKYRRRD